MGDGIIMDISDPVHPKVIDRVTDDVNFAFWHSATFNQDATKVVFTDELGGGGEATCNAAIGPNRGADGIYDLSRSNKLTFRSYYKIQRHRFDSEQCVAHNGSLVPVKGRDLMVQSWYMGGVSFWDFTDSSNPRSSATSSGVRSRPRMKSVSLGRGLSTTTTGTSTPPTSSGVSTPSGSLTRSSPPQPRPGWGRSTSSRSRTTGRTSQGSGAEVSFRRRASSASAACVRSRRSG